MFLFMFSPRSLSWLWNLGQEPVSQYYCGMYWNPRFSPAIIISLHMIKSHLCFYFRAQELNFSKNGALICGKYGLVYKLDPVPLAQKRPSHDM